MSVSPVGMSIQQAYRYFRDDLLEVNRKYQRKLVWTLSEKQSLIESIINDYPIPLILLAKDPSSSKLEILDGMQRLNAVFSYIENSFDCNGRYFDVAEFTRAKQANEAGAFDKVVDDDLLLEKDKCADFLDYQLAVTIYPATNDEQVTDVFGRINSGGKQLSMQEKRQAGMTDNFSSLVRVISSNIRGDSSRERLSLSEMPEISIDSSRSNLGYQLKAENVFWCKQGIIWTKQLRDSEDEEIIADILASLVLDKPIAKSRVLLDSIYNPKKEIYQNVRSALIAYGEERLKAEVTAVFSVLNEIIFKYDSSSNCLRKVISKSTNPIKAAFYSLFMALHDLIVVEGRSPDDCSKIMESISNLQARMITTANSSKTEDRIKNIAITKGLIQSFFVKKDVPLLRHGPGLSIDFENSLRRSHSETARYEFKQGILDLSDSRSVDEALFDKVLKTICGIANVGPDADGYLFIGVADSESDAKRIKRLDDVEPIKVGHHYVVGIDREFAILDISADSYVSKIISKIKSSDLSDPLKSGLLSQIDTVVFRGKSVIRICIPKQTKPSFFGEQSYVRQGSNTVLTTVRNFSAIADRFNSR